VEAPSSWWIYCGQSSRNVVHSVLAIHGNVTEVFAVSDWSMSDVWQGFDDWFSSSSPRRGSSQSTQLQWLVYALSAANTYKLVQSGLAYLLHRPKVPNFKLSTEERWPSDFHTLTMILNLSVYYLLLESYSRRKKTQSCNPPWCTFERLDSICISHQLGHICSKSSQIACGKIHWQS
jgi:hypothetical protein